MGGLAFPIPRVFIYLFFCLQIICGESESRGKATTQGCAPRTPFAMPSQGATAALLPTRLCQRRPAAAPSRSPSWLDSLLYLHFPQDFLGCCTRVRLMTVLNLVPTPWPRPQP